METSGWSNSSAPRTASCRPEIPNPICNICVTTFNTSNPQLYLNIDRTKAEALQVPLANVFDTLQSYLGSSFVNLFNKYNQVYQVYIQAGDQLSAKP